MGSGFQVLDSPSSSVELGFRIPIVTGILDSLSGIPESKAQDCGFHDKKFPGFRITLHWVSYSLYRRDTFEQLGLLH